MTRTRLHSRVLAATTIMASLAGAGVAALAQPAGAAPVLGGQLYGTGGHVTVEVLPAEAGFTSELRLCQPGQDQIFITTNRDVGTTVSLGTFPAGTELVFCIYVRNTGATYFMGPASRNRDNEVHASVDVTGEGQATVGFEDVWAGGDRDYNDNLFRFTGVMPTIPPPDCSVVAADHSALWPPNHKLVEVTLSADATVTGVTQDEPVNDVGDGNTGPDAQLGAASNKVLLRPERSGTGDGRVYRIAFTLSNQGGSCTGTVTVAVPHDQSQPAVDSGGSYDSLAS